MSENQLSPRMKKVAEEAYDFHVKNIYPIVVEVSYMINCVSNINAASSTYEIDVSVFMFWVDFNAVGLSVSTPLDLAKENIFDPEIIVSNEHDLHEISRFTRVINPITGEVKCSVHLRGSVFITSMSLELFPFDYQNLNLILKSRRTPSEKLVLKAKKLDECAFNRSIVHEWKVLGHFMREYFSDPETSSARKEYSILFITVLGRRQPGWFINNVFIITACLLFYSWTIYMLPPDFVKEKLEVTNCTLVAIIANKFVVGAELPKVEYKTLVDAYVDVLFYLHLFTTASVFVVFSTSEHFGEESAVTANWAMFVASAAIFIGLHIWLYFKISSAHGEIQRWHDRQSNPSDDDVEDAIGVISKSLFRIKKVGSKVMNSFRGRHVDPDSIGFEKYTISRKARESPTAESRKKSRRGGSISTSMFKFPNFFLSHRKVSSTFSAKEHNNEKSLHSSSSNSVMQNQPSLEAVNMLPFFRAYATHNNPKTMPFPPQVKPAKAGSRLKTAATKVTNFAHHPHRYHDDGDAAAHDLSVARVARMNARSAAGTARDGEASAAPTARATESMSQRAEEELASEDGGEGKFAGGVAAGATTGAGGISDFKWITESSRGSVLVAESAVEERRGAGPRTSPRPYSGGHVEAGDIYKVEELHHDN